jgi:hypothetical protein
MKGCFSKAQTMVCNDKQDISNHHDHQISSSSSTAVATEAFFLPSLFSVSILFSFVSIVTHQSSTEENVALPVLFTLRRFTARHGNGLATGIRRLEELAQTLLEHHNTLCTGSVGHANDRTPEIECVGDVTAYTEENEEDKVERVAEDCLTC